MGGLLTHAYLFTYFRVSVEASVELLAAAPPPTRLSETGQPPGLPAVFAALASKAARALPDTLIPGDSLAARMSGYQMDAHGKLLRPALCLWACLAADGEVEQALPGALAIEWIHNFTLVHDDVQDGDRLRRHRPTVWAVWGEAQAINAGDAMCARAFELLAAGGGGPASRLAAVRILARAVRRVVAGQCLDLAQEGRPSLPVPAYLRMVRLKTGALLGAALAIGAVLAGRRGLAPPLARAGELLGAAFQVRDDWLGLWGDGELTGKPRGDLARRKVTYPVLEAYAAGSGAERRRLSTLFADRTRAATAELAELLERLGGARLGETAATAFAARAAAALERAGLDPERLAEFHALARHLSRRAA